MLRKKLCEVKYLCDDSSTGRGIHNVVSENTGLNEKLKDAHVVIEELQRQLAYVEEKTQIAPSKKHPAKFQRDHVGGGGTGGASMV